jgi:CPA1 family monovalent cation:H+ antiporter
VGPTFALSVAGSLVAGPVLGWLTGRLIGRIKDMASSVIVQFGTTFGIWILAERVGLSGILTIVTYAMTVARYAPMLIPARLRVPSYAVWETVVFILNVLAFVLIGLQLGPIWERLAPALRTEYAIVAAAVLATVIVVRFAWVMTHNKLVRMSIARHGFHPPRPMTAPTVRSGLVISWCGMRGIVTLAAAFALPDGDPGGHGSFPFRDLILVTAFCVVLGTLVIQGLTLRPLLWLMRFADSDPVRQEVRLARVAAFRAALKQLDGEASPEAEALRREYTAALARVEQDPDGKEPAELPGDPLRRRAIAAARHAASDLRQRGEIGDDAFHRLEEELDRAELGAGGVG